MSREKGVVATEAVLSFALLLIVLLTLWSAVRLIYEKTSLDTAAQISAQSGVSYFLRNTPISCNPSRDDFFAESDRCQEGFDGARELSLAVLEKNICDEDRVIANEGGGESYCSFDSGQVEFDLQCKLLQNESTPEEVAFSEDCSIDDASKRSARALVIKFVVKSQIEVDSGLLNFFDAFSTEAGAYGWRRLN